MGLSFHYHGEIAKPEFLSPLIEELKEICTVYHWQYDLYDQVFPLTGFTQNYNDEIYGISFTPKGCETIFICFLSNGKMSSPLQLDYFGKSDQQDESHYLYMLSVKTQFSNPFIHATIIQLFKYISTKYFKNFELTDEGEYWETNNEFLLKKNFEKYNNLLDRFALGIETTPLHKGESVEIYFDRLLKIIHNGLNPDK